MSFSGLLQHLLAAVEPQFIRMKLLSMCSCVYMRVFLGVSVCVCVCVCVCVYVYFEYFSAYRMIKEIKEKKKQ
jgi:hypothetical protein